MSHRERAIPHTIDDAFVALRIALEENVRSNSALARVREPLQLLCRHARDDGLEPEHLLIRLKQTLDGVSGLDSYHLGDQADLRSRIVSLAIDAYFSEA